MIGHVHSKQSCLFSNVVDFRKKMTSWAFFTVGYRLGKFAANGFGVFFLSHSLSFFLLIFLQIEVEVKFGGTAFLFQAEIGDDELGVTSPLTAPMLDIPLFVGPATCSSQRAKNC